MEFIESLIGIVNDFIIYKMYGFCIRKGYLGTTSAAIDKLLLI